ncbi:phytanoyl-CoA dioxygenase family protein [Marinoscillum luteum]|uniref:Phytanoyl-CoA dioxygenase family protein n=1 Tax=Marinoscillum luteum TaxID=861051 RepID=A0ABW7NC14_9BACT
MKNSLKLYLSETLYKLNYASINAKEAHADVLSGLKNEGCFKIERFLSEEQCRVLVEAADNFIINHPNLLKRESNDSDVRAYGVERIVSDFDIPKVDNLSMEIFRRFVVHNIHDGFKLLGKITASEDNLGSGGGWHRDAPFMHQFKTILYLTDVLEENGPFQYIRKSNRYKEFLNANKFLNKSIADYRFSEEEVEKLTSSGVLEEPTTFTAPAGTLLFADTRGLHRGKPLTEGERYAITHYHYNHKVDENKFFIK